MGQLLTPGSVPAQGHGVRVYTENANTLFIDGPQSNISFGKRFPWPRVVAYMTSPRLDYCAGDFTSVYYTYDPKAEKGKKTFQRAEECTRQILFERSGVLVVFDRVRSAKPEAKKVCLWQARNEPVVSGNRFQWDAYAPERKDKGVVGRLFGITLLPEKTEVKIIGGPGSSKDYWLDPKRKTANPFAREAGKKYKKDPQKAAELAAKMLADAESHRWRLEIAAPSGEKQTYFLHVFQLADTRTGKMLPAKKLAEGTRVGAEVALPDGAVLRVLFNKTGPVGGHATLSKGGQKLFDENLATNIEDTYRRWKADPRFKKWTSDPRYAPAIPEGDWQR